MNLKFARCAALRCLALLALLAPTTASAQSLEKGKFGRAVQVKDSYAFAAHNPIYAISPLTVECWAKLEGKIDDKPQIVLANEPQHSVNHWRVYADRGTGVLIASFPGYQPNPLKSSFDIADGEWHYIAMVFDGTSLKLFGDGKEVASQAIKKAKPYPDTGPLTFGHADGFAPTPGNAIDEVRLSRVVRTIDKVPEGPFTADADTIGLWHFDEDEKAAASAGFADASTTRNGAKLRSFKESDGITGGFDGTRAVGGRTRWNDMDFGPFFSSTLKAPGGNMTHKAISIRLGKDKKHAVAFDTETLRMSVAWEGDFLKIGSFREGLGGPPDVGGAVLFDTIPGPGWAKPGTNDLTDPRPDKLGPLPANWGKYKGLYLDGERVVLSYTVGSAAILESPSFEVRKDRPTIVRTFEVGPSSHSLVLRAAESKRAGDRARGIEFVNPPKGASMETAVGWLGVVLPPREKPVTFAIRHYLGPVEMAEEFTAPPSLNAVQKGGPGRYPDPIVTKGELGKSDGPYAVDTLTAPDDNPWKSFLRFGGHDFFKNGDAAVCSVSGDVWVVSGIDDKLESLKWRRYATGLFQPLGLKIVDDKVYVLGRDQITRLHDLNNDGEADFYENFNSDAKVTPNGHAYVTGLETDREGNFYYVKCGDNTEHGGTVLRVSKDGSKLDVFATGIRNSNGLGVGPSGEITEADNQGEWTPASRLDILKKGDFLGFQPMSKRNPPPTDPGKPVVWMPQNVDNSSGGQVTVTSDKWGPFKGELLHTSYGAAALLHVMTETVDGVTQGGVYRFPLNFNTGIMRGRFREQDGQLYLSGLRGWQTAGVRDGALQRVRYTGKPVKQPRSLNVHANGIRLGFTCALDKEVAEDVDSYAILQWNYKWQAEYGSKMWSLKDPTKQGYDTVPVKSAKLLPDGKTVFLEIEGLRPVMQVKISVDLESADGTKMRQDVYNTIHGLGGPFVVQASQPALPSPQASMKTSDLSAPGGIESIQLPQIEPPGPTPDEEKVAEVAPLPPGLGSEGVSGSGRTAPTTRGDRTTPPQAARTATKKILLIAGKKSHGPGEHEYEKGVRLLKHCLDTSPDAKGVKAEVILDGWPEDERVFDNAAAIFLFSDGADRNEKDHPLLVGDRLVTLGKLMDRGVGLAVLHYTVFLPTERGGKQFQQWVGGYFDYDSAVPPGEKPDRKYWYSKLGHATTNSALLTPDHPILRGVKPFTTKTEYYWKMRFQPDDARLVPLLTFDPKLADPPTRESVVAWAVERNDGGRGFAFTEGHFHSNWQIDGYRRMMLNALLWTAKADVPAGGVNSALPAE